MKESLLTVGSTVLKTRMLKARQINRIDLR